MRMSRTWTRCGGEMKAILCLLLLSNAGPFEDYSALLSQLHSHRRGDAKPITLAEVEATVAQSNPEIRIAVRRLALVEAGVPAAGALEDPTAMYRAWGVPLREPWNFNQAQNMFM